MVRDLILPLRLRPFSLIVWHDCDTILSLSGTFTPSLISSWIFFVWLYSMFIMEPRFWAGLYGYVRSWLLLIAVFSSNFVRSSIYNAESFFWEKSLPFCGTLTWKFFLVVTRSWLSPSLMLFDFEGLCLTFSFKTCAKGTLPVLLPCIFLGSTLLTSSSPFLSFFKFGLSRDELSGRAIFCVLLFL